MTLNLAMFLFLFLIWHHSISNKRKKEINWNSSKLNISVASKDTIRKLERQPREWEKMFANYVSDKVPVSKINKEPSQFNHKKANDILKTKNTRGSCEKEPQACIFHKTHGDEKGWGNVTGQVWLQTQKSQIWHINWSSIKCAAHKHRHVHSHLHTIVQTCMVCTHIKYVTSWGHLWKSEYCLWIKQYWLS